MIPTFQRPYVWRMETQWEPLWEDIRNLAERLEEAEAKYSDNQKKAEDEAGTHFLGAVVVQQIPTATSEIDRRDIIDGQQRMTTLQILLDAAQEVLETDGLEKQARRLAKLVLNDEDLAEGDDRFKLWPTTTDRDAFRATMTNGHAVNEHEDSLIAQAHAYFSDQVRYWMHQSDKLEGRGDRLVSVLSGLLELVVIDLENHDDAYVIFETLNARGTPLLASDLVKNYVLSLASGKGLDSDKLHREHWVQFETEWWRQEVAQGRLVRPRIDVMMNYWIVARLRKEVSSQQVFPSFRAYVQDSNSSIVSMVKDLQVAGKTYRSFDEYSPGSAEGTFFYRWNVMQAGVITPVLLDLLAPDSGLPRERQIRCLRALESFLIRRTVCRMTTKDYNKLTVDLLEELAAASAPADEVLVRFLQRQESESRLWPDDRRFADALVNLPLYRLLTRGRLRLILEGIEEALRTGMAEEAVPPRGTLTIEHVLPQSWTEHWPLEAIEDTDAYMAAIERRDHLLHSLGNLTLVSKALNPALSNSPWAAKQDGFREHSTLHLNKRLLANWSTREWNEETILERGRQLAEIACAVWPSAESM